MILLGLQRRRTSGAHHGRQACHPPVLVSSQMRKETAMRSHAVRSELPALVSLMLVALTLILL